MQKKTIKDMDIKGMRVLVRVDFNVPIENGVIEDDRKMKETIPTIKYLADNNAKVILVSHLGRPKGFDESLRMNPIAKRLEELMKKEGYKNKVMKTNHCINSEVKSNVAKMNFGDILMLENVRFYPEEEKNDVGFAKKLSENADIYVNDAFGTSHRAHASTEGVAKFLPAVAGFLIEKELNYLGKALANPEKPLIAIVGGAKVSTKIGIIENLLNKVDKMLIGGGMTFTFLKAKGMEVGKSMVEEDKLELAKKIMEKANNKIVLPDDIVVADKVEETNNYKTVSINAIPKEMYGVDIGEKTVEKFAKIIKNAKTVVWNGPMGVFEVKNFDKGTIEIAKALTECKGTTIVGGGDSASAIEKLGFANKVSHVSTGGGASLEFLEGKELPGIKVLMDK